MQWIDCRQAFPIRRQKEGERPMLRNTCLAALIGTLAAAPVLAATGMVKSIDVETDLTDFKNPEAVARWKTLDEDLEQAIALELADRLGEDGVEIDVDMDEVELANFFEDQIGAAETQMSGTVHVRDESDHSKFETFNLTVKMSQIMPLLPEDQPVTVIVPTSDEVYAALVTGFARAVADHIEA